MTGAPLALAALLCWHLGSAGGLPKEVLVGQVRSYATGERLVRVLLLEAAPAIAVRSSVPAVIEDAQTGARLATIAAGADVVFRQARGQVTARFGRSRVAADSLRFRPLKPGARTIVSSRAGLGRRGVYPGALVLSAVSGSLRVVEQVELESYVGGVVAAEMPKGFPLEAMKAQAIAARSYALFHLGDHEDRGADLCAQVHCQAYAGSPAPGSAPVRAARETAGQVLAWRGLLVDALYHSACGGATAPAWEVRQGKLLPYLSGDDDHEWEGAGSPYCRQGHEAGWQRRFPHQQAERLIAANLGAVLGEPGLRAGRLRSLRVAERNGPRVEWLEAETSTGVYRVRGDAIRWLFGSGRADGRGLRSTVFTLAVETDRRGRPQAYVLRGVGHGHGIGLCQWGARGRAESGESAAEILAAYYPGTSVCDLRRE